ncbi:---NA--- [Octopus vulgaris]|uniref:---NA n=1 Tax=Octopus vulgaris TaxID=6645 RepID=A0AA36EWS8_OCTVU|nr:---NA--- [Octopus vulgaris]
MSQTYSFWGKKMIIDTYGKSFLEECLLTSKESHVILCDICGKSFSERNDLSNHKCTHTGEYFAPIKLLITLINFSSLTRCLYLDLNITLC